MYYSSRVYITSQGRLGDYFQRFKQNYTTLSIFNEITIFQILLTNFNKEELPTGAK